MALVTRCPKCSTMFRVVPDQLRVSAGWVRCGHCQEVFDAALHILPRNSEVAALGEVREREEREERAARETEDVVTNSAGMLQRREGSSHSEGLSAQGEGAMNTPLPPLPLLPPVPQSRPPSRRDGPDSAFMAELRAASAAVMDDEEPDAPPPLPSALVPMPKPAPAPAVPLDGGAGASHLSLPGEPVDLLLSELGDGVDDSGVTAPSFVQRARRRSQPASPHMRALFWFVLAALTLTLVLQVLISERNWLAARQPAFAPALRGLCGVFNCRVGPYQHIDSIVIDNSGFSRAADGSFLFHYTLRNQANLPVATPALELTLTDVQERPLVRRVLTVHELGAPASIAARGEHSGARTLRLSTTANPSAVTGYKLVAFYP